MVYKIRKGVFETNSSSVHSIVISDSGMEEPKLKHRKIKNAYGEYEDCITVNLGYFGKNLSQYVSQEDKLSYLMTLAFELSHEDMYELEESYSCKSLKRDILDYVNKFDRYKNCTEIHINATSLKDSFIDHQTLEDYYDIEDFSRVMGMDFVTFVFNKYVILQTSCD